MPIYATFTSGPIHQPNERFPVEILDQTTGIDFFTVRSLKDNKILETHRHQLELTWLSPQFTSTLGLK